MSRSSDSHHAVWGWRLSTYFPRHTLDLDAIEPAAFKRLSLSLVEMAVITGVTVRLIRAVSLTYLSGQSWLYLTGAIVLSVVVLFGMTAMHLANYTPRRWLVRAPLFGLVEAAAEMLVSGGLTLLGKEPMGTGRAVIQSWWELAAQTVMLRVLFICLFAAALAGVMTVVRRVAISREHDARSAEKLREELYSEAAESDIDSPR